MDCNQVKLKLALVIILLNCTNFTKSAAEPVVKRERSSSFYEPAAVAVVAPHSDAFAGFDFTGLPRAASASSVASADADSERSGAAVSPRPVYDLETLQRRNTELVTEKLNLERELVTLRAEQVYWMRVKAQNSDLKNNNTELARKCNELLVERESDHKLLDSFRAQLAVARTRPVTRAIGTNTDPLPKPAPIVIVRPAGAAGVTGDLKFARIRSAATGLEISGAARSDSSCTAGTITRARRASRAVVEE